MSAIVGACRDAILFILAVVALTAFHDVDSGLPAYVACRNAGKPIDVCAAIHLTGTKAEAFRAAGVSP